LFPGFPLKVGVAGICRIKASQGGHEPIRVAGLGTLIHVLGFVTKWSYPDNV
jgi:hypothetical protein